MMILIATSREYVEVIRRATHDYNVEVVTDINQQASSSNDVGISYMYLKKIPMDELRVPWINFHPGPLPEYKGRNLCYHAIMNGEEEFGATVHYMDEEFDTGPIIECVRFPIYGWDTAETLHKNVMDVCFGLFMEYLPRIAAGEKFATYANIGGRYYKKEPIDDYIYLPEEYYKSIRAITFKEHRPKIRIGGQIYEVVKK